MNNSLDREISDKDWSEAIQSLVDKGLIKITYDEDGGELFSLTELGTAVCNEIDIKFN